MNSVIPCHRGGHHCNWPACPQECDGRSGADAYSPALDHWNVRRALYEAIADREVWVDDGEFDPDAFISALEKSGYAITACEVNK